MPVLTFSEWKPDVSDLNRQYTQSILNCIPRGDGYGPFYDIVPYSAALPAAPRGAFYARKKDGSVAIFAGTETKLYMLDNITLAWTDVSVGAGTYTQLDADANWSFAQFNDFVVASQNNDDMQFFTLSSSTAFADLGGSPPRAAYLAVVNRFLVAAGIADNPNRVQWCALNDLTNWSTLEADYQDLPKGGAIRGISGGEYGLIIQDGELKRMVFSPGSDVVFDISTFAEELGSDLPGSIISAGGDLLFISPKGFMKIGADGSVLPIGEQRVNNTFFADYDQSKPNMIFGVSNPDKPIVFWSYKTLQSGDTSSFDKLMVYDTVQNKFAPVALTGTCLLSMAQPGVTLEGLNTIGSIAVTGTANNGSGAIRLTVGSTSDLTTGQIKDVASVGGTTEANGTWTITVVDGTHVDLDGSTYANAWTSGGYIAGSIDAIEMSLDEFSVATLPKLAAFDTSNKLCFFTGDALEATLETAEQTGMRTRVFCSGVTPVTDAATCYASLACRENMNATPAYTTETALNAQGFCPQRRSTRLMRARLRIPAGTAWTYATGVEPAYEQDGER